MLDVQNILTLGILANLVIYVIGLRVNICHMGPIDGVPYRLKNSFKVQRDLIRVRRSESQEL